MNAELVKGDLTDEEWREYDFENDSGAKRVYRITAPQALYFRKGGSTHRVLDTDGVVHCVPGPGYRGCVLRWKTVAGKDPVAF